MKFLVWASAAVALGLVAIFVLRRPLSRFLERAIRRGEPRKDRELLEQPMLRGTVRFRARIKGNGLTFPLFEFNPSKPGVEKAEMESSTGDEIVIAVHLVSVATPEDGRTIATEIITDALNRISFFHNIAIEDAQLTGDEFSPMRPQPGVFGVGAGSYRIMGAAAWLVVGVPAERLRETLQQPLLPGEGNFGLFRSARQSSSPVEEFVHLYHILLMLSKDSQANLDAFIIGEDPGVPQTPSPIKAGVTETVYTRLRNELAHKRSGVNLQDTKREIAERVGELRALTRRAIELCS